MKLNDKFKKIGSKITAAVVGCATCAVGAVQAFAEDATTSLAGTMEDAVSTGVTSAATSITSMLGKVAPVIIGIVVGVIVLTAGIAWIKKIRSNSK